MLSGNLQQQSTDADGFYTWANRYFSLDPSGKMLSVQDIDSADRRSEVVQMDLTGLKFAKEWTSVMNQNEVGFDVIWESGTIWSFLAESEAVCRHWVDSFNQVVARGSGDGDTHIQFSHKLAVPATPTTDRHIHVNSNSHSNSHGHSHSHGYNPMRSPYTANKTTVGMFEGEDPRDTTFNYTRGDIDSNGNGGRGSGNGDGHYDRQHRQHHYSNDVVGANADTDHHPSNNMSSAAIGMNAMMSLSNPAGAALSPIPLVRSGATSDKSSSSESQSHLSSTNPSNESSPGSDILVLSTGNENKENVAEYANNNHSHNHNNNNSSKSNNSNIPSNHIEENNSSTLPPQPPVHQNTRSAQLEQRYQQLQQALQRERLEANIAREQLSRVRNEVDLRVSSMEQEIQYAREIEFKKSNEVRDEVQKRFIETANDTLECHQSNIATLQAQHKREVKLLQEDMAALRDSHAKELRMEAELRMGYQQRESALKYDIASAQDKLDLLKMEHDNALQVAIKRDSQTKREYDVALNNLNSRITELEAENQQLLVKSKAELNARTQELTEKYTNCLNEVENVTLGTALKKAEADKRSAVIAAQHQWAKEAEQGRKYLKEQHAAEIEKLHAVYRERESHTNSDLQLLENAYNNRIQKLENQVTLYREQAANVERTLEKFKLEQMQQVSCLKEETHEHVARLHQQQEKVQELQRALEHAHNLNQQSSAQEIAYRDQCRRLMEADHIQKNALYHANQSVQQLTAELTVYKRQMKHHSVADSAMSMSLQIAQQESLLSAHELQRITHENQMLQNIVTRTDGILYGSHKNNVEPHPPTVALHHDTTLSAKYTSTSNMTSQKLGLAQGQGKRQGKSTDQNCSGLVMSKNKARSPMSCQVTTHSITKPIIQKVASVSVGRVQQNRLHR